MRGLLGDHLSRVGAPAGQHVAWMKAPAPDAEALRHELSSQVRAPHRFLVASDEFRDVKCRHEAGWAGRWRPARQLPTLLEALQDRRQKRTHLRQQLDGLACLRQVSHIDVRQVERELRAKLDDWHGLLQRRTPLSRQVVTKLLDGRLMFTPRPDRAYEFAGQVQFGNLLEGIVLPQVFDRFVDASTQNDIRAHRSNRSMVVKGQLRPKAEDDGRSSAPTSQMGCAP
jgi:hypothetical protein